MCSKTNLASRVLWHSGIGSLLRKTGGHGFVVLNYHRIGKAVDSELDRSVYSGTSEQFDRELDFLRSECDVIMPGDIENLPRRGRGNYVIITFDDGYRDNYDLAFPLLQSAGLRAVFFIATGFIDCPRLSWWDEIAWMIRHARVNVVGPTSTLPVCVPIDGDPAKAINNLLNIYKHLPAEATPGFLDSVAEASGAGRAPADTAQDTWMTWEMIREMRDAGMEIGGHTMHHPILANLSRFEQEQEILGCAGAIEKNLKQPMRLFSYPRGKPDSFNEDTRACLYAAGVQYAFSYYGGMNHADRLNAFDIHRVPVDADTPFDHFAALMTAPRIFA